MKERLPSQRGFTLLETTLVVALLGMLSAIAIPAYRGYIEAANEGRAISDIGTMSIALYRWELNTGSFPPDLATAGLDNVLDPWGRPYAYRNIAATKRHDVRRSRNRHSLNTDFDLYSVGKDGVSKLPLTAAASRDDIIRARNGGFIGRSENY